MYSEDRGRRRKDPWPFIGWPWAGSRATALGHTVSNREQFRKNRTPSAGIWAREGGSIWSVKFLIGGRGGYADGPHSSILKMTGGWVGQEGEAGVGRREGENLAKDGKGGRRIFLHVNGLCARLCRSHRVLYLVKWRVLDGEYIHSVCASCPSPSPSPISLPPGLPLLHVERQPMRRAVAEGTKLMQDVHSRLLHVT